MSVINGKVCLSVLKIASSFFFWHLQTILSAQYVVPWRTITTTTTIRKVATKKVPQQLKKCHNN